MGQSHADRRLSSVSVHVRAFLFDRSRDLGCDAGWMRPANVSRRIGASGVDAVPMKVASRRNR